MNALLDTCVLLWFLRGDVELSERAARLIEAPSTDAERKI
jgi:PIN domain nuclease of toxin-antitoxin system